MSNLIPLALMAVLLVALVMATVSSLRGKRPPAAVMLTATGSIPAGHVVTFSTGDRIERAVVVHSLGFALTVQPISTRRYHCLRFIAWLQWRFVR